MSRRRKASRSFPKRRPRDLREALAVAGPQPDEAQQRVLWLRHRAKINDSYRRRTQLSDPILVQERHSPTVEIAVDDPEAKRKARRNHTRVRQSEAWRHNQLSSMQRQAESEILLVWRVLIAGVGSASSSGFKPRFGRVQPTPMLMAALGLERVWRSFVPELRRRRIRFAVLLEVLTEPRTLAEIEHRLRLVRGRALAIYERALDLWCELRGWIRPINRLSSTLDAAA
jgi:hypothetical protein